MIDFKWLVREVFARKQGIFGLCYVEFSLLTAGASATGT
jgi:hypothetical protein